LSPPDSKLEKRALALLDEALEQPESERAVWVEARTSGDSPLRSRVLALLATAARDEGGLRTGGAFVDADEAPAPERVGAYRIVERIGQGGMGAVYRAERDLGDFNHAVAIKIIRPGALSDALIERFARERQTLADLAHPNIARLFDGGQTPDGQPYIVMEYVAGRPVTVWAREHALDTAARLRLFRSVCEAVRFAHQNLVIHRDLTPANVLVNAEGEVKLIDFGIARPPESADAEPPAEAAAAALSLTPGYAAPERIVGGAASTLIDIYSLGRLLEALLDAQPPGPDLQAIISRATAESPQERYPSVDALIEDLRLYTEGRPVGARRGGRRYAFGKFVARHPRALAASTITALLLVSALGVTLVAYAAADRARAAEARRFEELRSLASYMIFDLNGRLARVAGNTQARVGLAAQAQRYLAALAATSHADDTLTLEAARGFITLAHAQGVPGQPNLGEVEPARANLRAALRMLEEREDRIGVPERIRSLTGLAMIAGHHDSDQEAADRFVAQAEAALTSAPAAGRDASWHAARRALRHTQLEMVTLRREPERLAPMADRLEREISEWPAGLQRSPTAELDRATADYRAIRGYFLDELPQAVDYAKRAERRLLALDVAAPNNPVLLYTLAWNSYIGHGAATGLPDGQAEADRFLVLAGSSIERLLRLEDNDNSLRAFAGQIGAARSQSLSLAGRHAEAIAAQKQVVALAEAAVTPDRPPARLNRLAVAHAVLGKVALAGDARPLACDSFQRARAVITELERRNELVGTVGGYRAGMDANLGHCARSSPSGSFAAID
jgi:serine/threonine-protein kinase